MSHTEPSQSTGLSSNGRVEVLIPAESSVFEDLQKVIETKESHGRLKVKERDFLFFDEELQVLIVVSLSNHYQNDVENLLSRFEIKLDVLAEDRTVKTGSESQEQHSRDQPKDLLDSITLPNGTQPHGYLISDSSSRSHEPFILLVWRARVNIRRPKTRLAEPIVTIQPSVSLKLVDDTNTNTMDSYLEPYEALEPNVFESMCNIPGLGPRPPYLAASRLEMILPKQSAENQKLRLPAYPSISFKVHPATLVKLRLTPDHGQPGSKAMIASIDIDIIPFLPIDVVIEEARLTTAHSQVESLMEEFLPLSCSSKDSVTLLYKVSPAEIQHKKWLSKSTSGRNPTSAQTDVLVVSIFLKVTVGEGCETRIRMDWEATADYSAVTASPTNAMHGTSRQATHEGPSLLPSAIKDIPAQTRSGETSNQRLVITSFAPEAPVELGKAFDWKVMILNWTSGPARLALIPIPRIHRAVNQTQHFAKRHAPKPSASSFDPSERRHIRKGDERDISQAIVDENVVYAMQHSNTMPPEADLISLTSEVRIGPLGAGQCHECSFKMVAFKTGILKPDIIRIVNLVKESVDGLNAPGVITDIRDLPDIVVR